MGTQYIVVLSEKEQMQGTIGRLYLIAISPHYLQKERRNVGKHAEFVRISRPVPTVFQGFSYMLGDVKDVTLAVRVVRMGDLTAQLVLRHATALASILVIVNFKQVVLQVVAHAWALS